MLVIEYSRISLLKRNPKEFIKRYLFGERGFVSEYMRRGSFLHEILHCISTGGLNVKDIPKIVAQDFPSLLPYINSIIRISKYIQTLPVVYSEYTISKKLNNFHFYGILDCVILENSYPVLLDYKFTKTDYEPDDFQLLFYNFLWYLERKEFFHKASFIVCNYEKDDITMVPVDLTKTKERVETELRWYISLASKVEQYGRLEKERTRSC